MPLSRKKKGPRKIVAPTHNITAKGRPDNGACGTLNTQAWGKADLYSILREMMRDGYTSFTIDEIVPDYRTAIPVQHG